MQHKMFTRAELYDLVWSEPISTLTKKISITDSGLRKMCVEMNVPLPAVGYWQKIQHGKIPRKAELPENNTGPAEIRLELISPDSPRPLTAAQEIKNLQDQIELEIPDRLTFPEKLSRPDVLTTATKERHLLILKKDWSSNVWSKYPHCLDVTASDKLYQRALVFFDVFIKAMRARGHEVYSKNNLTCIKVFGEEMDVRLREKNKIRKETKNNWTSSIHEPTGLLYFAVKAWYQDKTWMDGTSMIEQQLSHILAYIEIKGKELEERTRLAEIERKEQERKRLIRVEFEKKRDEELSRFKDLLADVSRWQRINLIRGFIDEVEQRNRNRNTLTVEVQSWLEWARMKADWYDPQVATQDELLDGVDKDSLTVKKSSYW